MSSSHSALLAQAAVEPGRFARGLASQRKPPAACIPRDALQLMHQPHAMTSASLVLELLLFS
jgi:hypothetical protein